MRQLIAAQKTVVEFNADKIHKVYTYNGENVVDCCFCSLSLESFTVIALERSIEFYSCRNNYTISVHKSIEKVYAKANKLFIKYQNFSTMQVLNGHPMECVVDWSFNALLFDDDSDYALIQNSDSTFEVIRIQSYDDFAYKSLFCIELPGLVQRAFLLNNSRFCLQFDTFAIQVDTSSVCNRIEGIIYPHHDSIIDFCVISEDELKCYMCDLVVSSHSFDNFLSLSPQKIRQMEQIGLNYLHFNKIYPLALDIPTLGFDDCSLHFMKLLKFYHPKEAPKFLVDGDKSLAFLLQQASNFPFLLEIFTHEVYLRRDWKLKYKDLVNGKLDFSKLLFSDSISVPKWSLLGKLREIFKLLRCDSVSNENKIDRISLLFPDESVWLLPFSILLPIADVFYAVKNQPIISHRIAILVGRKDLYSERKALEIAESSKSPSGVEIYDMAAVSFLFNDLRVHEVQNLMQSSEPSNISLQPFEESQLCLLNTLQRTASLPISRALFTYQMGPKNISEVIQFPALNYAGKTGEGSIINLDIASLFNDSHYFDWIEFYNGICCSLSLPKSIVIETSWIMYNTPKKLNNEFAGFIMGLGLMGKLCNLYQPQIYELLSCSHLQTSMALLIGLSASKKGSMDFMLTKLLGLHVPSFLDETCEKSSSSEYDIPILLQSSALIGFGLLYCATSQCRISQILYQEMLRNGTLCIQGNSQIYSDSYGIAAAFALGLVNLANYDNDSLYSQLLNLKKSSMFYESGRALSSDFIRNDLCSSIALSLKFICSNRQDVSSKINLSVTFNRPDYLSFKIICKYLIEFDAIKATDDWINSHKTGNSLFDLYIESGLVFCIGLKYLASKDETCKTILLNRLKAILKVVKAGDVEYEQRLLKSAHRNLLNCLILSLGFVFCGSGNLEIMKILRLQHFDTSLSYGDHWAIHSSMGLLFCGSGLFSFDSSCQSLAMLFISFFPVFPSQPDDYRIIIPPCRFLWALCAKKMLFVTRDVDSNQICNVSVETKSAGSSSTCKTPFLLNSNIKEIRIADKRYYPRKIQCLDGIDEVFVQRNNWNDFLFSPKKLPFYCKKKQLVCKELLLRDLSNLLPALLDYSQDGVLLEFYREGKCNILPESLLYDLIFE